MADTHPLVGRTVAGRFRLTGLLGEGGMATVFVAEQDGEPREVAVKVMNEELTRERSFVRRFEREAKAASLVVHTNCVRIFAWGVADGVSYIAMELVRGHDLYDVLEREGPLSQRRVATILAAVCDALEVAHGLGIVHRDLKPENVMLVPDAGIERVKVLDFGIAKLVAPDLVAAERSQRRDDPTSNLTQAGTLIGTPAYMSPEQCKLEGVDARSDIYTCGVLMYQLVTGSLPFEGEAPLHTAMLHIHEPLRAPATLAPDLDPRLDEVIVRALAKDPKARYQTAAELAKKLRALAPALPDQPAIAGSKRAVSSRPQRAPSQGSAPQFPDTLRWAGDKRAPDAQQAPTALESQRTLVGDGMMGTPASVRLRKGPPPSLREQPKQGSTTQPIESTDEPSSDPADRAPTLIREVEDSAVMSASFVGGVPTAAGGMGAPARRSGPQGTEVIHLGALPSIEDAASGAAAPPKRREMKPTLRSADGFGSEGQAMAPVEIRVIDEPSSSAHGNGAAPDPEAQLLTLPLGTKRPVLGRGHTVPVPIMAHVAPTMELTDRPRMVSPFPIGQGRPAARGLAQMSGARVLLLGFVAGAILMAILGVVYFYVLR